MIGASRDFCRLAPPTPRTLTLARWRGGNGRTGLELHLWGLTDGLTIGTEIEELLLAEAERASEQRCREPLDAGVVFLHRVVEEASRCRDLVLKIGELHLQLLEILVGLQVG